MRPLVTLLLCLLTVAPVAAQSVEGSVRVRLFERSTPSRATVTAERGPLQVRAGRAALGTLRPGESATVERAGGQVAVRFGRTVETAEAVRFVPQPGAQFRLVTERRDRAYHGALAVSPDARNRRTIRLVNEVPLKDYVASVVPSEYPFPETEGVKAQAVLVRTYALKSRGKYGDYDLVDHVGSQVYNGIESETPTSRRAAEATQGEVLTHRGGLIEAVYSSSSGGHTADNDAIWNGRPLPYLRGRQDPWDRDAPDHEWTTEVGKRELHGTLSRHFDTVVTGIEIAEKSREGRVRTVRLLGPRPQMVRANAVRLAVNQALGSRVLRSTFFSMQLRGDRYHFRGRGFGHGVGMSQYGAREQARQGHSHRDILAFYFTDTRLERRDVTLAAPLYAEAPRTPALAPIPTRPVAAPPERPAASAQSRARANRTGW